MIERIPEDTNLPTIAQYNEDNRYISPGNSPVHGPYTIDTAPHMVEIMERMHPDDPCTHVTLMKSVQSTGTFHAELVMSFIIKHKLGSMGFYTASRELARARSSANIDVMIDDCNLADCVKPHSKRNARKVADSTYYKEFVGGIKLTINSYGSIGGAKSNTIPYMFLDEIDEAKDELKDQGDIIALLEGRTMAVRHFKIFALSTPTALDTSKIYRLFKEGDQRYFHAPCPKCGEMQILVLAEGKKYGLTYDMKEGSKDIIEPDSVRYVCLHCGDYFKESKKQWCLKNGLWIPSVTINNPLKHSYHVSGLLSPEQMLGWERICSKHAATHQGKNVLKYKDFTINYKGWPWARVEKQTSSATFKEKNLSDYCMGTVPRGGLALLGGADVHKDRIELLIMAVGPGWRRWFVDYRIFYGDIGNPHDMAWRALADFVDNSEYLILGQGIRISKCAIDCGYDPAERRTKDWDEKSHTVYNFVGMNAKFLAIRGSAQLKPFDVIKAMRTDNNLCTKVYMLNSSLLKDILTREITVYGEDMLITFPSRMHDGRPIDDEYIDQLLSERYQELDKGVMGWKKIRERNEVLDCWLYATGAAYFLAMPNWSDRIWEEYRAELTR